LFLQELGQIKFVDSRSDEEKLKEYFTDLAKQAGVSDEHMEDAVQEDLDAYFSKTIRERQSLLKDAEKHLSKLEVRSVEDLEKDYKKQVDSMVSEGVNWAKTNYHLAEDFINKVVSKGKFNGKTVDRKWADKILEAFRESRAVLDPRYMVLADPDEKGNQYMYIPEMVEMVDAIEFRKENVEFFKNQIKRGRAENLNERAEKAEQGRITKELQKETSSTKFDREWIEANKSFGLRVQN
jgi:polyhydroxyalkanoate synthesis regulator phasin